MMGKLGLYFEEIRYRHWIKNIFVFAPAFFGQQLYAALHTYLFYLGFVAFCLAASLVYLVNDYVDKEADMANPRTRNRPYASGRIDRNEMAFLALVLSILISVLLLSVPFFLPILIYIVLNFAYTFFLKKILIVNMIIVSTGFLLRLWVGSIACGVPLSLWLLFMTFLLAMFLIMGKKKSDLHRLEVKEVPTLEKFPIFNYRNLNFLMLMMMGLLEIAYILYCFSPEVTNRFGSQHLYFTAFFVVLGLGRYWQKTKEINIESTPVDIVLNDKWLQLFFIAWILSFYIIIY